jgi:two-component system phosphate regulon sensor histidine kinase PhoR
MNRRRFTWLIVMMVISLAGITGVQIYWIRNAIRIRNENFDNTVFTALHSAVGSLEASSRFGFFNRFTFPEIGIGDSLLMPGGQASFDLGSVTTDSGGEYRINITGHAQVNLPQPVSMLPEKSGDMLYDAVIPDDDSVTLVITSAGRPESGRDEVITPDSIPVEERVVISRNEYMRWLRRRASELQRLGEQMISELSDWERSVEIDNRLIGYTLGRVFGMHGISTPFEFAVIRDGDISGGQFTQDNRDVLLESSYNVRLFPGRMVRDEMLLSVIFPDKRNYVVGSMTAILVGSLLFSMIVIATFALSLFFIIRQKKITEMRADFINNMTHEFKTPIATISLAADTITNPRVINDENSIRHFVGMIKKENSRMNRQVETILQIASLDKHDIHFRFGDVALHSLIEKAVEVMEFQVQQRGGAISLKLDARDSVIYGDAEHLANLVHNLLDNANKYSPGKPEITVSTNNRDDGVVISVEDKGAGMSKTIQSRIFERFYRQPAGNIHNVKGFGLGLSYVRSIVDAHKGIIEVTSEPGKGSRFDVYLPFNWES